VKLEKETGVPHARALARLAKPSRAGPGRGRGRGRGRGAARRGRWDALGVHV